MTTATHLQQALQSLHPIYLDIINESMNHAGYFEGKESHFKVVIVSHAFDGKRAVARHQQIYALANPLLTAQGGSIHALALHTYTPQEWQSVANAPDSPQCAGHNKG